MENILLKMITFQSKKNFMQLSKDSDVDPLGRLKTTKKKAEYLMEYKAMKLLDLQIAE